MDEIIIATTGGYVHGSQRFQKEISEALEDELSVFWFTQSHCATLCIFVALKGRTIPMRELSIREMREKLGSLDRLVQSEGEVLITRRGAPIARLLPVKEAQHRPSHAELRSAMQRLETPSEALIRDDRDQR